jgi:hypothetical protein
VIASAVAPFSYCMCDCMCIAYLLQLATVSSLITRGSRTVMTSGLRFVV